MSYKIASFNMANMSLDGKKDLNRIASIIIENKFDIVAMQEVLSEGKAISGVRAKNKEMQKTALEKSLIGRLGKHWDSYWDDPRTSSKFYSYLGEDRRGEGYTFLWNTRRIELLDVPNNPRILRDYKTDFGQGALRLIRDPLYGRFKIKGTKIELRLITTHIISAKPKEDNMKPIFEGGAIALRKHEFEVLAGNIYQKVSKYGKDREATVPYTLIMGDYNLNLRSSGIGKAVMENMAYFVKDSGKPLFGFEPGCEVIYTVQDAPTTLGDGKYANNFDHFSYNERTKRVVKGVDRIDAVHKNTKAEDHSEEELFARFNQEVSDHVPIVIELGFR